MGRIGKRLTAEGFVSLLARMRVTGDVYNQYADDNSKANAIRRCNLLLYLNQMKKLKPSLMLVGEAPGHRGCRLTGIPLTSEAIMLDGVGEFGLFGESLGYRKTGKFPEPVREITATIVWESLVRFKSPPLLMWNAFPFHPFRSSQPFSNRRPSKSEILLGQSYVSYLTELFGIEDTIAMGDVAEKSLCDIGLRPLKVRHPAQGGKRKFVDGLGAILKKHKDIGS